MTPRLTSRDSSMRTEPRQLPQPARRHVATRNDRPRRNQAPLARQVCRDRLLWTSEHKLARRHAATTATIFTALDIAKPARRSPRLSRQHPHGGLAVTGQRNTCVVVYDDRAHASESNERVSGLLSMRGVSDRVGGRRPHPARRPVRDPAQPVPMPARRFGRDKG